MKDLGVVDVNFVSARGTRTRARHLAFRRQSSRPQYLDKTRVDPWVAPVVDKGCHAGYASERQIATSAPFWRILKLLT
jgi:hypothetical protein